MRSCRIREGRLPELGKQTTTRAEENGKERMFASHGNVFNKRPLLEIAEVIASRGVEEDFLAPDLNDGSVID